MALLKRIFNESDYETKLKLRRITPELFEMFRALDSKYIMSNYEDKEQQLISFIIHNQWRAEQRSNEWLEQRKYIIGASEVATIMGLNQYKTIKDLAHSKSIKNTFSGNFYTRWGCVLECVIENLTARIFDVIIYESGSIPGIVSHVTGRPIQATSPDGLSVISGKKLLELINNSSLFNEDVDVKPDENYITLFEFKVPAIRRPKGEIPKNYKPQVMTGMCTCNTDIGIFGDCLIRMSPISSFNWGLEYNGNINNPYFNRLEVNKVMYLGYIIFYEYNTVNEIISYKIDNFMEAFQLYRYNNCKTLDDAINDIGIENPETFKEVYEYLNDEIKLFKIQDLGEFDLSYDYIENIFEQAVDGNTQKHYSDLISYEDVEDVNEWFNTTKNKALNNILSQNMRPISIMPFKVFDIKYNLVKKDEMYVENLRHTFEDFLQKVSHIRQSNCTKDEKELMLEQAFSSKVKRTRKVKPKMNVSLNDDELNAIFN